MIDKERIELREGEPLSTSASCARLETAIEELYAEQGLPLRRWRTSSSRGCPTTSSAWSSPSTRATRSRSARSSLRRQRGLRRRHAALGDEEDQEVEPRSPAAQARHLQPGHASRRTSTRCATSTARPATRTWWSGEPELDGDRDAATAQRGPRREARARHHHPDRGGRALEARRDPDRGQQGATRRAPQERVRARPRAAGCARTSSTTGVKEIEELYHNTGYIFARIDAGARRARRSRSPTC